MTTRWMPSPSPGRPALKLPATFSIPVAAKDRATLPTAITAGGSQYRGEISGVATRGAPGARPKAPRTKRQE